MSCGVPTGIGVEAFAGPLSSSALTVDLRLLLFWDGDVFALGPLELVPCWLACSCMPGACMCPGTGLPRCGLPGRSWLANAGLAPIGNWLKLGVRGPPWGMLCPFMFGPAPFC